MNDGALFLNNGAIIRANDFNTALADIGLRNTDTIFAHSDLTVFGKIARGIDRSRLCNKIIEILEASIPNGTIVMPTFTYAFCKNGIFDRENSPSEVGMLTEFFRREKDVTRSSHPIFSVAALGSEAEKMTEVDTDSFGEHSFFAKLHEVDGLIVFFGASFERATFAHYIEQAHGVPYRFLKTFDGILREKDREREISSTYLVRHLDQNIETYLGRLEEVLRSQGALTEVVVGSGKILAVRARDMFSIGMRMLDADINAFLKHPPKKTGQ